MHNEVNIINILHLSFLKKKHVYTYTNIDMSLLFAYMNNSTVLFRNWIVSDS